MHTIKRLGHYQTAVCLLSATALITGCANTPNTMNIGSQSAKTSATGSAGGATATNANSQLQRCDQPFGTVALVEDQQADWYVTLTRDYRLTSTVPVLRLLVQQSNCFVVVERGRAFESMQRERTLERSGELRANSNFGRGQMVSADYTITPSITFSAKGTQGAGAAVGMLGGPIGLVAMLAAGGLSKNEAATTLLLSDNRSGVQVGASEGSASNFDFSIGAALFGGSGAGGLGGYTNTPQGKVIVGAFVDSFNQLVHAARSYTAQSMGGRGLGTGGKIPVDGATQVVPSADKAPGGSTSEVMQPQPQPAAEHVVLSMLHAQRKLAALGYDPGPADGVPGPRTARALKAFQTDRKIVASGQLDRVTMAELSK